MASELLEAGMGSVSECANWIEQSDLVLVDNGLSDQDVSASLVFIICIGRVNRIKQVRGSYPNGRIFVTGNVKNEEAICLRIVGR